MFSFSINQFWFALPIINGFHKNGIIDAHHFQNPFFGEKLILFNSKLYFFLLSLKAFQKNALAPI